MASRGNKHSSTSSSSTSYTAQTQNTFYTAQTQQTNTQFFTAPNTQTPSIDSVQSQAANFLSLPDFSGLPHTTSQEPASNGPPRKKMRMAFSEPSDSLPHSLAITSIPQAIAEENPLAELPGYELTDEELLAIAGPVLSQIEPAAQAAQHHEEEPVEADDAEDAPVHHFTQARVIDSSQSGSGRSSPINFQTGGTRRAFKQALLVQKFTPTEVVEDLNLRLKQHCEEVIQRHHGIKIWVSVELTYRHNFTDSRNNAFFTSKSQVIYNDFQIDETLEALNEELLLRNAHYLRNASPMSLDSVDNAVLHVARFNPVSGSSYKELPRFLTNKKCIVNVHNEDNRCFGFSVLASLCNIDKNHRYRSHLYLPFFEQYHLDTIQYPVAPKDVPAIEDQIQINVNLFSFFDDEGKGRFPLYVSKKQFARSVDLLYWDEHYAAIKDFPRFLSDITKMKARKFF